MNLGDKAKLTEAGALREIVLEVGGEGGSLKIVREKNADGVWQFCAQRNETALYDLLSEEDRAGLSFFERKNVKSLEEALRVLDRYPWSELYPLALHPRFAGAIFAAVRKRGGGKAEKQWRESLRERGKA